MPERRTAPTSRHVPPSSLLSLLSGWVQQGVESFFATQRVLVDIAMRQNALAMKSFREVLADPEHSPVAILTDLAVEGASSFIEAQQILLNLVQQENDILMTGVKERVAGLPVAAATTDLVRRSIHTFVGMQEEFLKITKKQTISWLESFRDGKTTDESPMVVLAREGMENFIRSQKKFLDIIAEEAAKATSGKPRSERIKKTELAKLAREGVDAFIDAQKKLLDVAGQQMNVNLHAARKTMSMLSPMRLMPMANITGEGVRNFVEAEKALIDSVVKPSPKATAKSPRRGRPPARGRKPSMARAATAA